MRKLLTILTFTLIILISSTLSAYATEYKYNVPYISQLDYPHWGQSACMPTSVTMLLKFHYPNSGVDVAEVYGAATQVYTYYGPLTNYRNVGWATNVWAGTAPDTGLKRLTGNFNSSPPYGGGNNSEGVNSYITTYLNNMWGGSAGVKQVGTGLSALITELKSRPVVLHVNEGFGGHYLAVVGYNDNNTTGTTSDDSFYINDPYHPYQQNVRGTVKVSFAKVKGWSDASTTGHDMITFTPEGNGTSRRYSVLVDNGIDNYPDTGTLNRSCTPGYSCFTEGNRGDLSGSFWRRYHQAGKDWIYPTRSGSHVKWIPVLNGTRDYDIYVRFYADGTQGKVTYELRDPYTTVKKSIVVDQTGSGFKSIFLGRFSLSQGWYIQATNIPVNCNMDAVFFRHVG